MLSSIRAGLLAAVPLAVILIIYTLIRGKALAAFFRSQGDGMTNISETTWMIILLAGFIGMALVFGALSGLVFGWLGMPIFRYVALSATVLFSILAVVSKQPLPGDKIVWNLAVGLVLGALVPILAR
jgi:hypothetical protein